MPKVVSCKTCNLVCESTAHLVMHERTHSGAKPYACTQCDHRCTQKSNLTSHIKSVHDRSKLPQFKCTKCAKVCTQERHLVTHMKTHTEATAVFTCQKCTTFRSQYQSALKQHVKEQHGEKTVVTCTFDGCGKTFDQDRYLTAHLVVHSEVYPFVCTWPNCTERFSHASSLTTHTRDHQHPTDKLFKCTQCSFQSNRISKTREHKEAVHDQIRPHLCARENCGKTFSRPNQLRIHTEAVHLGLRPFACTVAGCDYVSAYAQQIAYHREFGHRADGTRVRNGVEYRVLNMVEQHYPELERGFTVDVRSLGIARQRVQVDAAIRFLAKELLVLLEVDEDQHRDPTKYTPEGEVARMSDATEVLADAGTYAHVLWVRFNPSSFLVGGVVRDVTLSERVQGLHRFLEAYEPAATEGCVAAYLFYDRADTASASASDPCNEIKTW